MVNSRSTYAVVDIEQFGKNIDIARRLSKSDIIAVVKADAYGHGAIQLSNYAYKVKNVKKFAVATLSEALELRKKLTDVDIIVLGYVSDDFIESAINAGLTLSVFDDECAYNINKVAEKLNKFMSISLEIDTGMSRLGFYYDLKLSEFLERYPRLKINYVQSHLATSDSDNSYAHEQTELFDKFLEINKGYEFFTSFLNSSGIASYENRWQLTRPGILLYGYESSGVLKDIKPIMSIFSEITHVKMLKKGQSVSYGRTYTAKKDMIIGVIPIGYADGYLRSFSNKGFMIANGRKCNVVGSVCMDMTMIDITELGADARGTNVEVLGGNIDATVWASWGNTISYEVLTNISYRIPRIYKNYVG